MKPAMTREAEHFHERRAELYENRKKEFIYRGILQHEDPLEEVEDNPYVIVGTRPREKVIVNDSRLSQEQIVKMLTLMVLIMAIMSHYTI